MSADTSRVDCSLIDDGFLSDFTGVLDTLPDRWVITCGWRDGAVEKAGHDAWLADPSKPKFTNPDNSAHVGANFPDGKSRAADVTLVVDGADVWDVNHPSWQAFLAAVLAHPRLHGLSSIGDYDHAEKLHWQRDKIGA